MPQDIIMRHIPAHFFHLFASSHYTSSYYVYIWAKVLDANIFEAFKDTGDIFDKETADKSKHTYILVELPKHPMNCSKCCMAGTQV